MSDLRYGLRTLLREPGFTLAAVLVLALGTGATTAIFTLVQSVLLAPLPYPDSHRLVWMWNVPPRSGIGYYGLSGGDFQEIRAESVRQDRVFESTAGFFPGSWNATGIREARRLSGARVTERFFETLGVRPELGRLFRDEEYRSGSDNVVVLSHRFWVEGLGGDPGIVGRRIALDAAPFEVAGVMPPEFPLAERYDMWAPLARDSSFATGRRYRMIQTFGRLKPGVDFDRAQMDVAAIAAGLERRYQDDRGYSLKLVSFTDQEVGRARQTLWVFAAAVGCLLLIACTNVASLLLARGSARAREMAVRAAVGAGRWFLVRQMLVESALLALAGGAAGLPLAVGMVRVLMALDPDVLPRAREIHPDLRVLAFALFLSLITGLIFGVVPALRGSRVDLNTALKEGGRSTTAGRSGNRFRSALVAVEVALGVILLASAGLLARSFQALSQVHPGYDSRNVLTMQIALSGARYRDVNEIVRFFDRLLERVDQLPGVESAGSANVLPLAAERNAAAVWLDTQPVHNEESKILLDNRVVTPGYFRSMGATLLNGRFFTSGDRAATPKVVVVNDVFARQFFPAGDALGHRITIDGGAQGNGLWTGEIAGVVRSFRESSLAEEPRREIFTVLAQTPIGGQTLVVRSTRESPGLAAEVRGAVASLDPDVPVYNQSTMREQVNRSLAQSRLRGALLAVFSAMALILASLGIYGLIACTVAERRQEIGIRMAFGARHNEVRRMIVAQGLKLTLAGLVVGLAGAAAATQLLKSFLYGVGPGDPMTYLGTALVFLAVALAASYLPARRATRVDPLAVLREE